MTRKTKVDKSHEKDVNTPMSTPPNTPNFTQNTQKDPPPGVSEPTQELQISPVEPDMSDKRHLVLVDRETRLYEAFIYWLSIPEEDRIPFTLAQFCVKYKTNKSVLREFTKQVGFYDALEARSIEWAKSKVPAILHILFKKVKLDQSTNDMRAFIQTIREYEVAKKDSSTTINIAVINPSDEQYRQIIQREAAVLSGGGKEKAA